MVIVTCVKPLKDYKLEVLFDDGVRAEINVRPFIKSQGLSQPLNDETFFKTVKVDEAGGITWSNGFDFCPVFLRQIALLTPPSVSADIHAKPYNIGSY